MYPAKFRGMPLWCRTGDTVTLKVGLPSTDDRQGVIRGTCERNEPRGLRHRDRVLGNVPH